MSGDSPFIMESFASHHGHPVVDALTGQIRSGTQCHVLFRRLDVMPDDVWVSIGWCMGRCSSMLVAMAAQLHITVGCVPHG